MEFLQLLLLLLSLVPAVYLCLRKISTITSNLPPGSSGWPLIGETLDYYFKCREGDTFKFLTERWNKYSSNVFRTSLLGEKMLIFSGAEGNKFLFSNEMKLVRLWWPSTFDKMFPKTKNLSSGEHSQTARNILRVILKLDVFQEYIGIIDEEMKRQLQRDWSCERVIVSNVSKRCVFSIACKIFLSMNDPRKIEELTKKIEDVANGIDSFPIDLPGMTLNRAIKAASFIRKELEAIIQQRRIDPSDYYSSKDLMSHMLLETDENGDQRFCDKDIASHLASILLAGYSSIHGTVANIMKYLAELPDVYDSVLEEQKGILDAKNPNEKLALEDIWKMKYSWRVACEVMRIEMRVGGTFREAITNFTYEGYTIPKGSKIHWTFASTHSNPKYFPDPEKFDPTRFLGDGPAPYTYVPFGGGPRMCPGNEYTRIIILMFMHNVVTKFRLEKLIPEEKIVGYPFPRPAYGLPVILHPHNS